MVCKTRFFLKIGIKNKNIQFEEAGSSAGDSQRFVEGNGVASNAIVTFVLPQNVEIADNLPDEISYSSASRMVTIQTNTIKYGHLGYVTIPLKVSKNTNEITINENTIAVEGKYLGDPKTIKMYLKGDWDQNNEVRQPDLMYARSYLAKTRELGLPPIEIYDFDGNNKPGLADLNGLRNILANMEL